MPVEPMSSATFRIPAQVMARQVGDETVILDLVSGLYFGLDEVGSRVWELIAQGESLAAICRMLVAEYDVPADTLASDVASLVGDLQERGLIDALG